jgi:hypothetical protein
VPDEEKAMRWTIVATVAVLGMPPTLLAQQVPPVDSAVLDSVTVAELSARVSGHDRVRVQKGAVRHQLRDPILHGGGITYFGIADSLEYLSWTCVEELQIRTSAWLEGITIGASIFGGLGLLTGVVFAVCDGGALCNAGAADVARFTAAGMAFGAAFGGILGTRSKKWTTIYWGPPEPARRRPLVVIEPPAPTDGGVKLGVGLSF